MQVKKGMEKMEREEKRAFCIGALMITAFAVFTLLIQWIDVQSVGVNGTSVGFAALNTWFHRLTGVHMRIYHVTDWLSLVPVGVCLYFAGLGFLQWLKRKSLLLVDADLLLLGVYYAVVVGCYMGFEMNPVHYRPVLIDGRMEASYPSSTTLLVLGVMPTLAFQVKRRFIKAGRCVGLPTMLFTGLMVLGRLISGVHWLVDIMGASLLSAGLFHFYKAAVLSNDDS